jgi:hypothetical protein
MVYRRYAEFIAAREQYEKQSGKNVVTPLNAKNLKGIEDKKRGETGNESIL